MFRVLLKTLLFLSAFAYAVAASLPSFTQPALSPDRSEIAFVSGGDIWTVPAKGGEARMLVSHPATESRPLYSPDGKKLAFTSTRTGNGDIYVLTFATGELTRLTYSDASELLDGWSHDGKWIYFTSSANDITGLNDVFRVDANGGTPLEVTRERYYNEFRAAPSPDGKQIAFVAKGMSFVQWWRHGHSHLDESEIWLKSIRENGPYRRIVEEDAKQGWPMWSADGGALFYTSDRTGAENIFEQTLEGKSDAKQVTAFEDGRLLWPSISYDGREIVFERNFAIYKLDTKSGKEAEVPIALRGAPPSPAVVHQQITSFSDMALSPDSKKVAVIAHGDVFAASAADGGEALRITHTAAPESALQWSPDSNRVVYVSSRNRHSQIFEYDLTKNAERQITNSEDDDNTPTFSPDGKLLAYVRGDHELHVLILEGMHDQVLDHGFLQRPALAWSPDSQFLAYTVEGTKSFRNIYIVAVGSGKHGQPASFLANGETASRIAWSPDGKYLLFDTAQRSESSEMARVDLVPHLPRFREDQFQELFRNNQPGRTPATPSNEPPGKPSDTQNPPADSPSNAQTKLEEVAKPLAPKKGQPTRIVFEGIRNRLTFMPLGFDVSEPQISPDGKTLVFLAITGAQRNLYSYSLDELASTPPSPRQLTSTATPKSSYQFSSDSKTIYYLDAGHLVSVPIETHIPKPIAVTAAMDIDFDAEKMAAFEQGWATLDKRYYDPKFHGHDWNHLHDVFAPYVAATKNPDDMRRVVNMMIGELNSSHSGINAVRTPGAPASPFAPTAAPVGRLGLRFEREPYESGKGLVIREIIPLSPAALEGTVTVGEVLTAVDGEPLGPHTNLDKLLENKVDRRVVLQVAGVNGGSKRDVFVRPESLATEEGLLYRAWVESNRAYVDEVSGGKLGYVHIADMSAQSLTQLYIDLDVQNQSKQGVIIDIRNNNGGFINEYAIDVFTRKNYLTMTPRGGSPSPARPYLGQRALGLPTVLVTNQHSLSDAEDFTEGYRALKLGKVVGEPTAGWIIYTGSQRLVDGSVIRVPAIRVQAADGEDMELHPRPVDVFVERLPGECLNGHDTQLDRAVKELLSQLHE